MGSTASSRLRWLLLCLLGASLCHAQELEPRAYSPSPIGTNFLVVGYAASTGGVVFDPSLPFTNVDAHVNAAAVGYGRTYGLFGHLASIAATLPYAWGTVSGDIGEARSEANRSGLADARLRLSMNLFGGPSLTPAEFAQRRPQTAVGTSLTIAAPSGQYDPTKLVNIGANRWSFKPEFGVSHPVGKWYLEGYAGAWLFTENSEYFGGTRRKQDPILSFQAHVSYTIRPRLWLALNSTYYDGGRSITNGVPGADLANSRVGLTLSVPVAQRQSLKFSWSDGATTRLGADFTTLGIAWQYAWFDQS